MHLGRISCLFNSHAPNRRKVQWNGIGYVGTCRSCGRDIIRSHHSGWRSATAKATTDA